MVVLPVGAMVIVESSNRLHGSDEFIGAGTMQCLRSNSHVQLIRSVNFVYVLIHTARDI